MNFKKCLLIVTLALAPAAAPAADADFEPLFDGKTLNGWKIVTPRGPGWEARDGMIVCPQGGGGKLLTEREFSDFILRYEYRITPAGNNGVNIRAPYEGRPAYVGMEIQILDDDHEKWAKTKPAQKSGSIYDVVPARTGFAKKPGEWNKGEITARGRQITVKLNGTVVTDVNLDTITDPAILAKHPGLSRTSGHVGFLGHGTLTEFRNVRIKELK